MELKYVATCEVLTVGEGTARPAIDFEIAEISFYALEVLFAFES